MCHCILFSLLLALTALHQASATSTTLHPDHGYIHVDDKGNLHLNPAISGRVFIGGNDATAALAESRLDAQFVAQNPVLLGVPMPPGDFETHSFQRCLSSAIHGYTLFIGCQVTQNAEQGKTGGVVLAVDVYTQTLRKALWTTQDGRPPNNGQRWCETGSLAVSDKVIVAAADCYSPYPSYMANVWDRETFNYIANLPRPSAASRSTCAEIALAGETIVCRFGSPRPISSTFAIWHRSDPDRTAWDPPLLFNDGEDIMTIAIYENTVVTGGRLQVRVWDVQSQDLLHTFPKQSGPIWPVALNSEIIVTGTIHDGVEQDFL